MTSLEPNEPGTPDPSMRAEGQSADASELRHLLGALRHQLDHVERIVRPEVDAVEAAGKALRPVWATATAGENRLPVSFVVAIAVGLQLALPARLAFKPLWLLPSLEGALLIGLVAANPRRINRSSKLLRSASLTLIGLTSLANAWSAVALIRGLVGGTEGSKAGPLLASGGAIYVTNIIVFALWYWDFDRGGPVARSLGTDRFPDFYFPQFDIPQYAPTDWAPEFFDYLYTSFTNATAFSPTDVMPLSRWAKAIMLVQSAISLVTVALVVARAVNILK